MDNKKQIIKTKRLVAESVVNKMSKLIKETKSTNKGVVNEDSNFKSGLYTLYSSSFFEPISFPESLAPYVKNVEDDSDDESRFNIITIDLPKDSDHSWAKIMAPAHDGKEAEYLLQDELNLGKERVGVEGRPGQAIGRSSLDVEDGGNVWVIKIRTGYFLDV